MNTVVGSSRLGNQEWIQKTFLVQYRACIKDRIRRHKLTRDEQEGSDIGWHRAVVEWTVRNCVAKSLSA